MFKGRFSLRIIRDVCFDPSLRGLHDALSLDTLSNKNPIKSISDSGCGDTKTSRGVQVRACLPRSGEFNSVAEEEDRRLFMTGSMCLDRFMVETDLLSASTNTQKHTEQHTDTKQEGQNMNREFGMETLTRQTDRTTERTRTERT